MPGFLGRGAYVPLKGYDVGNRTRTLYRDAVWRKAGLWPGDKVLDLGCGVGTLSNVLAANFNKVRVVGVDSDTAALARCAVNAREEEATPRLTLVRADATELPFVDETFRLVVAGLAFSSLDDPLGALEEAHRVAEFGGKALFVEADFTRAKAKPRGLEANVFDEAMLDEMRGMGWGKLAVQRIDVLADGTQLNLVTAKRFDADDAEVPDDEDEEEDDAA
ncbi:MAG: class I SAM-dependent methyltransferase [Thermoplasmatota archaeon]